MAERRRSDLRLAECISRRGRDHAGGLVPHRRHRPGRRHVFFVRASGAAVCVGAMDGRHAAGQASAGRGRVRHRSGRRHQCKAPKVSSTASGIRVADARAILYRSAAARIPAAVAPWLQMITFDQASSASFCCGAGPACGRAADAPCRDGAAPLAQRQAADHGRGARQSAPGEGLSVHAGGGAEPSAIQSRYQDSLSQRQSGRDAGNAGGSARDRGERSAIDHGRASGLRRRLAAAARCIRSHHPALCVAALCHLLFRHRGRGDRQCHSAGGPGRHVHGPSGAGIRRRRNDVRSTRCAVDHRCRPTRARPLRPASRPWRIPDPNCGATCTVRAICSMPCSRSRRSRTCRESSFRSPLLRREPGEQSQQCRRNRTHNAQRWSLRLVPDLRSDRSARRDDQPVVSASTSFSAKPATSCRASTSPSRGLESYYRNFYRGRLDAHGLAAHRHKGLAQARGQIAYLLEQQPGLKVSAALDYGTAEGSLGHELRAIADKVWVTEMDPQFVELLKRDPSLTLVDHQELASERLRELLRRGLHLPRARASHRPLRGDGPVRLDAQAGRPVAGRHSQ